MMPDWLETMTVVQVVGWLLVAVVCLLALIGAMPTDADPLDVRRTPLPDRCCTERPAP